MRWDLGNAIVSFETSPLYTYQDEGFFDIQLVAINAFGCQDTTLQTNEIIDPPSPDLALVVRVRTAFESPLSTTLWVNT